MNYYPGYGNQYFNNQMQPQIPRMNMMEQQYTQYTQPLYKQSIGLQGKSVDSVDVVKAMDIPLDGSISYFPLTDGSAIVSKQLQMDGTSKTIIYEPVKAENDGQVPKYLTLEDLTEHMKTINEANNNLGQCVNDMRGQIFDLANNLQEILEEIKSFKGGKK